MSKFVQISDMKIIIATGIYPPDIGGPAIYSDAIARELARRGFKVKVICYSDSKEASPKYFEAVRVLRKYPKFIRYFLYSWKLFWLARSSDIIYAQGPLNSGLPALVASKILRKKFVVKLVGDYAWEQGMERFGVKDLIDDFQKKRYCWQVELIRKIQKMVSRKADIVITPSNYIKGIVSGRGVGPEKIKVVYNSVDVSWVKKLNFGVFQPQNSYRILSIARLVPWKGLDTLIEIMPELLKENPNFRLIIIGDGPEKDNLESKIKSHKLENKVKMTGRVNHEKVIEYLKNGDLFVLNTGYEGLSHQLIEAMAAGIPIITTNVCGNPETIRDGYNGLLINYNNREQLKEAILKIWRNKELRERFIENGYKELEKFRFERMIEETLKILKTNKNEY